MEASNIQYQAMANHSLEEQVLGCLIPHQQQEKRLRPQPEQALRCPRCDSTNTKFCYYNNYSLSQPRYFCKGCRRYWTKGGSLRNVPVGGGCRKHKRSSSSSTSSRKTQQDQAITNPFSSLPPPPGAFGYDPNDLTLAFARLQKSPNFAELGLDDFISGNPSPNHTPSSAPAGFLDVLRGGFLDNSTSTAFHFQNLCYGYGGNMNGEGVDGGGSGGGGGEVVAPLEEMSGATQDQSCKSMDADNKVMVGLQWQLGGDGKNNMVVDSGRGYWNGVGSSLHGLVNSSLM